MQKLKGAKYCHFSVSLGQSRIPGARTLSAFAAYRWTRNKKLFNAERKRQKKKEGGHLKQPKWQPVQSEFCLSGEASAAFPGPSSSSLGNPEGQPGLAEQPSNSQG